jgi:hypothetical protein
MPLSNKFVPSPFSAYYNRDLLVPDLTFGPALFTCPKCSVAWQKDGVGSCAEYSRLPLYPPFACSQTMCDQCGKYASSYTSPCNPECCTEHLIAACKQMGAK